jgi:predicted nucleic acid-binding protein
MLVVDSSVWIANFRGARTEPVRKLAAYAPQSGVLVGDVVLLELLQGVRSAGAAMRIERSLRSFAIVPMLGPALAVEAAANYRLLRDLGIAIRKMQYLIIGTYCIEHRHALLHDDSDFEPMRVHLGLQVH